MCVNLFKYFESVDRAKVPGTSALASDESVTPLFPSPLEAVWPPPTFGDGLTPTPPSGPKCKQICR